MIKKNDVIRVDIESITNLGFGVGRCSGLVVFVSSAVTGDTADVKIIKVTSSYAVGRVEKFIKFSDIRTKDRCPCGACFGCAYKNITYEEELKIKKNDVTSAFLKSGLPDLKINDVIPCENIHRYRNKAQYPIAKDKNGNYIIGFYAPKSHRVTEARKCPLAPVEFEKIINTAADFFKKHDISVYNEEDGVGLLRHIYLRRGEVTGEILLTLVINGDALPFGEAFAEEIFKRHKDVVGVLLNINKKKTNVILGDKFITLKGRDHIYDILGGVKLKITAPSFYQVNHSAAEVLYAKAKELAAPKKSDILLDLYCGAGSVGLSMADSECTVYGIEIVESAVECARENASRAGYTNARFYMGDAKDSEKLLSEAESKEGKKILPDIIIFDPPRAGCDEKLLRYAAKLSPERIVYISCNPETLARDARILKSLGYGPQNVTPVDLFPGTGHVECVLNFENITKQTFR